MKKLIVNVLIVLALQAGFVGHSFGMKGGANRDKRKTMKIEVGVLRDVTESLNVQNLLIWLNKDFTPEALETCIDSEALQYQKGDSAERVNKKIIILAVSIKRLEQERKTANLIQKAQDNILQLVIRNHNQFNEIARQIKLKRDLDRIKQCCWGACSNCCNNDTKEENIPEFILPQQLLQQFQALVKTKFDESKLPFRDLNANIEKTLKPELQALKKAIRDAFKEAVLKPILVKNQQLQQAIQEELASCCGILSCLAPCWNCFFSKCCALPNRNSKVAPDNKVPMEQ